MITKIEKIQAIGNFEDYVAVGDVTLKEFNLIYAENGAGKTTLTSIFRSLSSGETSLILKRKRVKTLMPQIVSIKDTSCQFQYNSNQWNQLKPDIEIFDTFFVNENIYSGFDINNEHKKKLHQFILGQDGVRIKNKINKAKTLISIQKATITQIEDEIKLQAGYNDVEKILSLEKEKNIDILICTKERELEVAKSNEIILKKENLSNIEYISLPFDLVNLGNILSTDINNIEQHYLETIQGDIKQLEDKGLNNASKWLYSGYKVLSLQNDICPFCKQSLDNAQQVVKAYSQYFNEEYNTLIKSIKQEKSLIENYNLPLVLSKLKNSYKSIKENEEFWKRYFDIKTTLPPFINDENECLSTFTQMKNLINKKQINPIEQQSIDVIIQFKNTIEIINKQIRTINSIVASYNEHIKALKQNIRSKEIVEKELKVLKIKKMRYELPLGDLCNKLKVQRKRLTQINQINSNLQKQQKTISNTLFSTYGDKINYYLRDVFCTKFLITNTRDAGYRGQSKEPLIDYTLTFDGEEISFEENHSLSIKHSLSEGDKNTIAFSFFLAKLDLSSQLNMKTIIFDDPLSSLDLNRRNRTISLLTQLKERVKQIIILSHNLHFLLDINSINKIKKSEKRTLQILNNNGKSCIVEYDLKKDWLSGYYKAIITLEEFQKNPNEENKEKAISCIRLVLESFLKFKYCKYIPDMNQTFGAIISTLETDRNCNFSNNKKSDIIRQLYELNNISWRAHHAPIEECETMTELHIQLAELQQIYIPQTLQLIYKDL